MSAAAMVDLLFGRTVLLWNSVIFGFFFFFF